MRENSEFGDCQWKCFTSTHPDMEKMDACMTQRCGRLLEAVRSCEAAQGRRK
jgi:hypothetical protein